MDTARLNELADLLERAPGAPFDGRFYYNPDGSGCCAMGVWADAHPERWRKEDRVLNSGPLSIGRLLLPWPAGREFASSEVWAALRESDQLEGFVREEFGVTEDERVALFGAFACGGARTRGVAAKYVREFVANGGATRKSVPIGYRVFHVPRIAEWHEETLGIWSSAWGNVRHGQATVTIDFVREAA